MQKQAVFIWRTRKNNDNRLPKRLYCHSRIYYNLQNVADNILPTAVMKVRAVSIWADGWFAEIVV